jgi:hypothetical protein
MKDTAVFTYWKDWLNGFEIDASRIPQSDFIEWVEDMEEIIGDALIDCIPDEWEQYEYEQTPVEEWEDLPNENDEDD